jgi:L-lactate dehydrogenase
MNGSKVAVIGAGGVGATIAYAALINGVGREIALYDIDAEKVQAEVLDLNHGLRFTPTARVIGSDQLDICADADIVVITAGAKQRPGETRMDLAGRNTDIFRDLIPALVERAPGAVVLVVTNPVDVLTYVALQLSGLPPARVIGSGTVLDTSRLHFLLAERCGVAVSNVHATIAGEHGDSEFALWSSASIGTVPLQQWVTRTGKSLADDDLDEIAERVKHAAYDIIRGKGATTYAIGLAVTSIVGSILNDEHRIMPVSTLQEGEHGITDVCLSMPAVIGGTGVIRRMEVPLTGEEQRRLDASADTIRQTIRSVGF